MVPPHDIPVGKKPMADNAGRLLQSSGKIASKTTSSGIRSVRPVAPERTDRARASTSVETCTCRRMAAVRSVESRDAIAIAWASRRGREVPIGIRGSRTAASKAMIATAHTISSSVKPSCEETPSRPPACNVGRCAGPAFLSVGAERQDVICAVLTRRSIYIRSPPWIQGHNSTFEIRAIPDCDAGDRLHEGTQSFRARGTTAGVEIKEIERACEALDLNFGGLDLRLVQIVEHARPDERHDETDDCDHDQDFHEREAAFASLSGAPTRLPIRSNYSFVHRVSPLG